MTNRCRRTMFPMIAATLYERDCDVFQCSDLPDRWWKKRLTKVLRPSVVLRGVLRRYLGVSFHLSEPGLGRYSLNLNPIDQVRGACWAAKILGETMPGSPRTRSVTVSPTVKRLAGSSVLGDREPPRLRAVKPCLLLARLGCFCSALTP